jgi:hypothetical protein
MIEVWAIWGNMWLDKSTQKLMGEPIGFFTTEELAQARIEEIVGLEIDKLSTALSKTDRKITPEFEKQTKKMVEQKVRDTFYIRRFEVNDGN